MIKKALFPILLLILSACKTKLHEQHPEKYLYLDGRLPFSFDADSYGKEIVVVYNKKADEYEGNYRVTTDFFVYDTHGSNLLDYTTFTVDLYNSQELNDILKKYENPPNVMRENFDQCFPGVPYVEKGKKTIKLNIYNRQTGQLSQNLASELYTFGDWNGGEDGPDIPKYSYWIIINQAPGLPKNKTLRILLNFPSPDDIPSLIKLKADISKKICEYAKSFMWVEFDGKFSPDRWKEIPWSNKYPHPKVSVSKND